MSHPIADELEARLNRTLAEFATTHDAGRALSDLCHNLVDAVRDLEDIRGGVPQRLSEVYKTLGEEYLHVEGGASDLISDIEVQVLEYLPELPELDLMTVPKFWVRNAPEAQETIPLGLSDLDLPSDLGSVLDAVVVVSAPSTATGPVDVYLGNRRVGTSTARAGDALRSEAMRIGTNLAVLPCTVVSKSGTWRIVIDGESGQD